MIGPNEVQQSLADVQRLPLKTIGELLVLSTSEHLLSAVSFKCDAYGTMANRRPIEPTITVAIKFYGYVSADTETYGRNLPPSSTHKLRLS